MNQRRSTTKAAKAILARGDTKEPPVKSEGLCVPRDGLRGLGVTFEYPLATGEDDDDIDVINGTDMAAEPGARIVPDSEVRRSTGDEYAKLVSSRGEGAE